MPTSGATSCEQDVFTWSREQADALRRAAALRINLPVAVDFLNVAEEIESLGISQLRELLSRYTVLLAHLLKWRHQPEQRGPSWRRIIRNQRTEVTRLLRLNPSLKPRREPELTDAYRTARDDAADETGLPPSTFPESCPFSNDEVEDVTFWPEAGADGPTRVCTE